MTFKSLYQLGLGQRLVLAAGLAALIWIAIAAVTLTGGVQP
jgi:hypothetical protein